MDKRIGMTLADRFEIRAHHTRTQYTDAFIAHDNQKQKDVLLSIIKEPLTGDERFVRRFQRNARLLQEIAHPKILRFRGLFDTNGLLFFITDLPPVTTLKQVILQRNKPFNVPLAHKILEPVCKALGYAHYLDVIHRNISSEKIFLGQKGNVFLGAFDIPVIIGDVFLPPTPFYTPPELFEHSKLQKRVDLRADLFSLGVVLYEMLTGGVYPYQGDQAPLEITDLRERVAWEMNNREPYPPSAFNPEINPEIDKVVLRVLLPDASKRFPSAMEFLNAYTHAMSITSWEPAASPAPKPRETSQTAIKDRFPALIRSETPLPAVEKVPTRPRPKTGTGKLPSQNSEPPKTTTSPGQKAGKEQAAGKQAQTNHAASTSTPGKPAAPSAPQKKPSKVNRTQRQQEPNRAKKEQAAKANRVSPRQSPDGNKPKPGSEEAERLASSSAKTVVIRRRKPSTPRAKQNKAKAKQTGSSNPDAASRETVVVKRSVLQEALRKFTRKPQQTGKKPDNPQKSAPAARASTPQAAQPRPQAGKGKPGHKPAAPKPAAPAAKAPVPPAGKAKPKPANTKRPAQTAPLRSPGKLPSNPSDKTNRAGTPKAHTKADPSLQIPASGTRNTLQQLLNGKPKAAPSTAAAAKPSGQPAYGKPKEIPPASVISRNTNDHNIHWFARVEYNTVMRVGEIHNLRIGFLRQKHTGDLYIKDGISWFAFDLPANDPFPILRIIPGSLYVNIQPGSSDIKLEQGEDIYTDFSIMPLELPETQDGSCNLIIDLAYGRKFIKGTEITVRIKPQQ